MRYLCSVDCSSEADAIVNRLENEGIPIVKTNIRTHGMLNRPLAIDLWVGIEDQYADAIALLRNPHHKVANMANVADFHQHLEDLNNKPAFHGISLDKVMNVMVIAVIVLFITWASWTAI